jgi:tagatose 1,6-diphosphate aldolase
MTISPGKYWRMRQLANDTGHFTMLAVDQRPPIKNLVSAARGEETARIDDIKAVKQTMLKTLSPHASATLIDPTYALVDALNILQPQQGLIVTLEDSIFTDDSGGRMSRSINNWSVEKICKLGGHAVKVLAWYRPDQSEKTRLYQQDYVKRVGDACREFDIPFLLEFLVYPLKGADNHTTEYVEQSDKHAEHVIQTVEEFAAPAYGVDIFKLESPLTATSVPDPGNPSQETQQCQQYFTELGKAANRPWVMLSAGATRADFKKVLHYAYNAGASGYLAGRAIWWDDAKHFPDIPKMSSGMSENAVKYMQEISTLTAEQALPWQQHAIFNEQAGPSGGDVADFASWYNP